MINVTGDPYIPNWRANVSHYATNETLRPGDENTTVCTTCHKTDTQCAAYGLTADQRAKWGNAPTVTMGNCYPWDSKQGCWICHISSNENLQPGDPVNPPSSTFHGSDIDNFMWNCQRCHPE
jgi:hypothetical protein